MRGAILGRLTGCALVLLTAAAARAQDALTAAPDIYHKVLENPRVRVLEANFKPGAKAPPHSHPEHLLYMKTDGTLIFKQGAKTPYEMTFKAGEALWLPAQTGALENNGDKPVRALVVELKGAAAAIPRASRASKRGTRAGSRKRRR
jgi:quercetin dioxygenase-like cupin family protein